MPITQASTPRIRRTLEALRSMVDPKTVRLENGRRIGVIVPPPGKGPWSLNKAVVEALGGSISFGTMTTYVGLLVRLGYIEPGSSTGRTERWVDLDREFVLPESSTGPRGNQG